MPEIICLKSEIEDFIQRWKRIGLTVLEIKPHTENSDLVTLIETPKNNQGIKDETGVSCFGGVLSSNSLKSCRS